MQTWVHLAPVILTDALYFLSVPADQSFVTGTNAQRQIAYLAAEQAIIQEIGAPLLPTSITGTFMWPELQGTNTIILPHKWINSIGRVNVLYGGGTGVCGLQNAEGCFRIRDEIGYVDTHCVRHACSVNCGTALTDDDYQVQITYTAGLPTGIAANDTSLHMALAIVAEEILKEIVDPGANPGGPGAPGVVNWSTLGYSETPNPASLFMTAMGASARMNFANRLIRHLKRKKALRF